MLEHQGEGSATPTEPYHTPSPDADTSHPTTSSIPLPSIPTAPISPITQPAITPIRQYSRRARIAQSSALLTVVDEPASPVRDVSEGEACPTESAFIADQDRATIAKSSTLPHDSAPRVTSPAVDEGIIKMARLQFCDYHNVVAILEKGEFNSDFHPMVDFIASSPLRYALTVKPTIFVSHIRQFWSTARIETTDEGTHILATVDGISRTVYESSLRRNLKVRDEDGIVSIPDTELFENLTLMGQYSRRARIAQSSTLPTIADEPASYVRDVSEGEACHTDFGFIADQDRATIAKSSTLPHDLAPRVTSLAADEGSMQHNISELTALCTSLQRQYSELQAKFQAQKEEIVKLKERVKVLEDKEDVAVIQSRDDAPIKGRSINKGEAAAKRISNDSEEIARVLTS
nr:hypothetical protein [Tanacetum cinerariifolium]